MLRHWRVDSATSRSIFLCESDVGILTHALTNAPLLPSHAQASSARVQAMQRRCLKSLTPQLEPLDLRCKPLAGPPLFGTCEPQCIEGGCLQWNMCQLPPNRDWMKGAIGAPLLLIFLVSTHMFLMWARRFHGSGPAYLVLVTLTVGTKARKMKLLPPTTASNIQIVFLAGLVVMAVMVSNVGIALSQIQPQRMSLGEAQIFVLETDGCDVLFKSKANNLVGNDQMTLSFWITANGSLSDVNVQFDACGNTQYLTVNNSRLDSEKYQGYSCVIHFEVPQPVRRSSLPALEIRNLGTRTTSITQDPDMVLDLGPNYMRLSGSLITLDMFNAKVRLFNVDIESGSVSLRNATFDTAIINTVSADITLSVSNDPKMQALDPLVERLF